MAFQFPGDVSFGGNLNLNTGSNIVLPSGSDIVLGEGANIQGQGDLDGNFSGSFTGSLTGSFIGDGSQIVNFNIMNTVGNLSGSRIVGDIQASSVEYDNVLNKPTLVSGSQQIIDLGFIQTTGSDPNSVLSSSLAQFAKSASQAEYANTASMALAVSFEYVDNLPNNLVSSSQQVEDFGFVKTTGSNPNLVQSSSHAEFAFTASHALSVPFNVIEDLPENLVSSSEQIEDFGFITASVSGGIDYDDVANKPTLVSGSQQIIDLGFVQTTGSDPNLVQSASHAEFAFTASHALSVPFNVIQDLPENLVSSSQQVEDFGFVKTTGSNPNLVQSASHAEFAFTASHALGVPFDVISDLPDNLVSSSQQVEDFGFVRTTGSDPNLVQSASHAEFAFTASHALSVPFNVIEDLPENLVSSSQQVEDFGFVKTTGSNPNLVQSSSHAEFAFTASHALSVPFNVIEDLPENLVSSSIQIEDFGFVKSTGSNPNLVQTASLVEIRDQDNQNTKFSIPLLTATGQGTGATDIFVAGRTGGNGLLEFNPSQSILTVGRTSRDGIINTDRITLGGANISLGGSGDGKNIDMLAGGGINFTNASSLPAAITNRGVLLKEDNVLKFASGSAWYTLIHDEALIDIGNTTGNISGSRVVGDIQASSVDFDNVLNKPILFSQSIQVDINSVSGDLFYGTVDTAGAGWISGSQQIEDFGFVKTTGSNPNLVASSSHAEFAISASVATTASYAANAESIDFANVENKPTLVSGSSQVVNLIDGQDINVGEITATSINTSIVTSSVLLTTGSNIFGDESTDTHEFTGSVSIKGDFAVEGLTFISSSQQITDFGFVQTTGSDPNLVQSASHAEFAFTASHALSVPFNVIEDLPENLVSGSAQTIANLPLGTVSSSAQVTLINTAGNISASRIIGSISADNVDVVSSNLDSYQNLIYVDGTGNSKTLKADSGLTYNSSLDILRVSDLEGTATTASFVHYNNIGYKPSLVSGSAQITLADTTGNISGSRVIGDIAASSVDYANVNNKPTLVSSSAQINLASATGTAANATSASFATTASFATMAGAVDFDYVENLPNNLVSSSAQVDEFNSGLVVKGGNLQLASNIALELSGSSGVSTFRYRTSEGDNKIFMTADHDNDFIKFSNRAANGYFNFFANNATEGASGEQKVAEFRHNEVQFFQKVSGSSIEVSGTITGDISTTTGNISGSRIIGDIQASSVEFDSVLNKPALISSSAQVNLASATGTAANATSASFATTASFATMAGAVDFDYVENLPDNLVSSSAQINLASATGTASNATSASYVSMDDIDFSALTHYDDDTAAAAGGVPVGKLYRNGNFIQVRLS